MQGNTVEAIQGNSSQGLQVVMLCSVAVGYQCFGGPCCLHLQGEVHGAGK
jgi:hypothetical protein